MLKRFFCDSETIFWARIQLALGLIGTILEVAGQMDLSPILPAGILPYWLIGSGILTEVLRRYRATDLGGGK